MAELRSDDRSNALVFPGERRGQMLSDRTLVKALRAAGFDGMTVHGMRSTFRSWCADHAVPPDIAEAALAHVDRNKVQAAYQRSDLFTRRRTLMDQWATFLSRPLPAGEVVSLRQTAAGASEAAA
jgi:integrase